MGVLSFIIGIAGVVAAAEPALVPPDLTHGGTRDKNHDWLLGPTGARGWVFFRHDDLTATSRQILITAVEAGSPADGILRTNDVILGVDGKQFADDARKSFAYAITAAEEKNGVLRLIRWRAGQSTNMELKLAVLGAYSDTAPYDCPKSKAIFKQGCRLIAKKGFDKELNEDNAIPNDLNALALLASGKEEYRPMLAAYAKTVAASLHPPVWTWFYGYGNLFLAEYILVTGDKSVLPELTRTAKEATMGQSAVGTWGHEFYTTSTGNLNGYGCMNQPGIPLTISLVLARQAGVNDPAVDLAIEKSARFLRYYVDKGSIPYGDHQPGASHENNGMCSSLAVLFDLLGDREAVAFYSRMATAAYDEREHGHCGNFWNMLWALPGASRGGSLATGAYLKEQSWYYDLARNWKGGFVYQLIEEGEENDNYTNWDLTGGYLLSFGLPHKSLYVMGKKPSVVPPLKADEVKEVIAAGRDFYSVNGTNRYDKRTTDELLAGLSSWSPAMRNRSAKALGKRDGDVVPTLLKMLAGSDRNARYGACEALGCLGPRADAAAPQLRALLKNPDPWLQTLACYALPNLGPEARKASVDDLLRMAAGSNPADPRRTAQRAVGIALFSPYPGTDGRPILAGSIEGVDRSLLYPAVRSLLENDDSVARAAPSVMYDKLTDRDLAEMLPAIIQAIGKMAPSDEMFADGIRLAGLDLLSRLHVREGIPLCVSVIELDRWGAGDRIPTCLECLGRYGVHANKVLPQLKEMSRRAGDSSKDIDKLIADIEASTNAPTLVDLKGFIAHASANGDASTYKKK